MYLGKCCGCGSSEFYRVEFGGEQPRPLYIPWRTINFHGGYIDSQNTVQAVACSHCGLIRNGITDHRKRWGVEELIKHFKEQGNTFKKRKLIEKRLKALIHCHRLLDGLVGLPFPEAIRITQERMENFTLNGVGDV
jgi:hypothetical protein